MKRVFTIIVSFAILFLMVVAFWVPLKFIPGMTFAADDEHKKIYFGTDSLRLNDYEDGGRYLDAAVRTEYINISGQDMVEEATWHIDVANSRYKVSFPFTYDCEGNALET